MDKKTNIFGKTLNEIQEICRLAGLPAFTAKQICHWLYIKNISSFDEMTNISKTNRELLSQDFSINRIKPTTVSQSKDGTKKYLFPLGDNRFIEAAMIPDGMRKTLCLSSQAGCKRGCTFCMTAKQGFQSNLSSGEILSQFTEIEEAGEITNIVYMGMGEPMDNIDEVLTSLEILTSDYAYAMSPKRITVSTIGVIPAMKRFLDESSCHLAISIHSPFTEERTRLMPVEKVYPIKDIVDLLKSYDFSGQRRVSFEYIMFDRVNDDAAHSSSLSKLLKGLNTRINLISFHQIPDSHLKGSSREKMEIFQSHLNKSGIMTTIRKSRGQDIEAACGLLSTKEKLK
jgi:23S rRNA (adenine2503-C2)-methyltransferase